MITANTPKVSIIMPTWNRAAYIMESIESVLNQTFKNWELIIVDDGSDDNTADIVSEIKDERIHFYKAGRIGIVSKIKNMGLEKATGELVAFIDSDDLWAPAKLEKQVVALQEYPEAGLCLTGGFNFRVPGVPVGHFYRQKEGVKVDHVFLSFFNSEVAGFTQALLFRKECLAVSGYFNETRSFSDIDFILSLAWHFKAVILYEPLVYRHLHDENHSDSNWEKNYDNGIETIRWNQQNKRIPSNLAHDALFRLYINFGEKSLRYKKRKKAIHNFLKAWGNRPFSIIPLKKIAKVVLS